MGNSASAHTFSSQFAEANILQGFSGACNVNCNNTIRDVQLDLVNVLVNGGIAFRQRCVVDANCLFDTAVSAVTDLAQKASNSSAAQAASITNGGLFNREHTSAVSRQEIHERISQQIANRCNVGSSNYLSGVRINAVNAEINDGIEFAQDGDVAANCAMNAAFDALAAAQQSADNNAKSGKDKKGNKKGKLMTIVIILVLLLVLAGGVAIYMRQRRE